MVYSLDFRRKVLQVKRLDNLSFRDVAKHFRVGLATIVRWSKKIEPRLTRNKSATKIDMEALKRDVELYPDAYNYERAERFGVSPKGIFEALKRLGVTYKKNPKASQGGSRQKSYFLPENRKI